MKSGLCASIGSSLSWQLTPSELRAAGTSNFLGREGFVMVRALAMLYLVALLAYAFVTFARAGDAEFVFIYFTYWTLLMQIIYFALALALTWRSGSRDHLPALPPSRDIRKPLRPDSLTIAAWVFQEVVYPASFAVAVMYWALVYPNRSETPSIVTYQVHIANLALTLVDCLLARSPPIHFLHVYVAQLYAVLFLVWSVIQSTTGVGNGGNPGDTIYKVLDWQNDPRKAAYYSAGAVLILLPALNGILYMWRSVGVSLGTALCGLDPLDFKSLESDLPSLQWTLQPRNSLSAAAATAGTAAASKPSKPLPKTGSATAKPAQGRYRWSKTSAPPPGASAGAGSGAGATAVAGLDW